MSPADLIQELRDKDAAWQKQCDGWIENWKAIGGMDTATIGTLRRTVYREAADTLAANVTELAEIRAENERLRKALEAGKRLANVAYNVHQRQQHITSDEIDSLKSAQEEFDAAIAGAA